MKRKIFVIALCLAIVASCAFAFVACNDTKDDDTPKGYDYDAIADTMTSEDGTYELAFVTDVGQLKDKSFNQGTWEGIKRYAYENNKTYKYYQPANGDQATDPDRYNAMKAAADAGAKVVVCAGFMQGTALTQAAQDFPEVKFVFIDGWAISAGDTVLTNVAAIDFQEEQSGYLAGYAAVKEGYTKLGFAGGGGGTNPACRRFGYGYVQGAEAAAVEMGVNVTIKYSWLHGANFNASPELQMMLNGWYTNGTEVVFACGGSMCKSAFAAASANQGKVIGVDVDQSSESSTVITSATKGLRESVMYVLEKYYSNTFDSELGGKLTTLGAADDAVGLPTDTWSLVNFSVSDYNAVFAKLKNGEINVDKDPDNLNKTYSKVTLDIVE